MTFEINIKEKSFLVILAILTVMAIAVSMNVTALEADVTVTTVTVFPESVKVNESATIAATVENAGNATQNKAIVFKINEKEVKSVTVILEPGETKTVKCVVAKDVAGTYSVTANNVSATLMVLPPTSIPDATPASGNQTTPETISKQVTVLVVFLILGIFVLLIGLGYRADKSLNKGEMRRAIAGTLVTGFVILVFLSLYYEISNQPLVIAFIELVGIVVGFYFGSKTFAEKKEVEEKKTRQIKIENVQFSGKSNNIINTTIRNSGDFEVTVDRVYINNEPKKIEEGAISPKSAKNFPIEHKWKEGEGYRVRIATTEGITTEKEEKSANNEEAS
ncbi:MAG: hypothetical protein DIAAKJNI_00175 [Candidatus Argoarchaeum ethanivorans]|uniref:CARDB domain-containing protein n=1 Tax=Candidatus Argoarchaeum ethanivorans TaxID=2608793 RepID=A0A811T8G6_9EURY|nr:MAG: hypothetical protein DIAAKJNI_00175 [Candidatus Argoarchaeum ethanivorans]